jgi:hypothetical protein
MTRLPFLELAVQIVLGSGILRWLPPSLNLDLAGLHIKLEASHAQANGSRSP